MKKICFVIDNLGIGGTQKLTVDTINFLYKNLIAKIDVIVLYNTETSNNLKESLNSEISTKLFSLEQYGLFKRIYIFSRMLKEYDLVHSCLEVSNLYVSLCKLFIKGQTKFVASFHGTDGIYIDDNELREEFNKYGFKQKIVHTNIQNFSLRLLDKYIAVSKSTADFLINKRKLDKNKIDIVYQGLDLKSNYANKYSRKDLRKKFNIADEDFLLGYFGRFSYAKGLENLIESFAEVSKSYGNVKLILIGEGELESRLQSIVKQYNLSDKIIFSGFKSDINEYYKILDLYIMPSLSEGVNLSLLEAMYNKVLVLTSDAGGSKEVIKDSYNGFLFHLGNFVEMKNKIDNIINNRYPYDDLVANAYNTILNKFDLDKNLLKVQNLFENLMKK